MPSALNPIRISLIGAGNVATRLGLRLVERGFEIRQVWSARFSNARALAEQLGAQPVDSLTGLSSGSDFYVYAVKDDALPQTVSLVQVQDGIHLHTAGAVGIDVFKDTKPRFGVLYPMQTFSKERNVPFDHLPLFIEASSPDVERSVLSLARRLSDSVHRCDSNQRRVLHLAAVFCCNFPNLLYDIAAQLLSQTSVPFETMLPLMRETIDKLSFLSPREAQTGPAVRGDRHAMARHLELLQGDKDTQDIYRLLSDAISKRKLQSDGQ